MIPVHFSVKPTLKKVSKYENKFKMAGVAAGGAGEKQDFRANLKVVKKETNVDELLSKVSPFPSLIKSLVSDEEEGRQAGLVEEAREDRGEEGRGPGLGAGGG